MGLQGNPGQTVPLGLAASNGLFKECNKPKRKRRESNMPVVTIEAPPGLRLDKKKMMVKKITAAIDEAYEIGDTLIFIHEDVPENVGMNGTLQSENPKLLATLKKIST